MRTPLTSLAPIDRLSGARDGAAVPCRRPATRPTPVTAPQRGTGLERR